MGHKTGLKKVGAQGRVQPLDRAAVEEAFAEGEAISLTELAQQHTETAIGTLVDVMGDADAAANARVSASTRILEFAHGKAAQSVVHTGNEGGLTINILRLSDGDSGKQQVIDAIDIAKDALEAEVTVSEG